ncbi:HPF/RaiA family ribosome-associated protein [Schlesneria sp. T3-172]|uniref:HPF/RaiA family ribosome-associated protein n=1 Tax=Schlesneria sphaerica TaxID=3373610 RepID=UPI0037CBF308
MKIQVTTDNHTMKTPELKKHVEDALETALKRFGDRVTRVEVHLSDENSSVKNSDTDKRCVMEARLAGLQPMAVTAEAAAIEKAIADAAEKLERRIGSTVDRLNDPKGRTSFAGEVVP